MALAVLVYARSMGFVLNAHFCQDELKDRSLFLPVKNCHEQAMEDMPADCPMHRAAGACIPTGGDEKDCCDDRSQLLKNDQEQQFDIPRLDLFPVLLAAATTAFCFDAPLDRLSGDYLTYKPPLLVCDLPVSLQTFRC